MKRNETHYFIFLVDSTRKNVQIILNNSSQLVLFFKFDEAVKTIFNIRSY